jgi:hypothetical protein
MKRVGLGVAAALALASFSPGRVALGQGPTAPAPAPAAPPAAVLVDRVVVRWQAPETGGAQSPQFIFERELSFEARLESLSDPDAEPGPYHDRHVRAALDRHIGESLLAALPIVPPPEPRALAARAAAARAILEQRVKGRANLLEAAAAEGIGPDEIDALLQRKALAGTYLDRMIAPMFEPGDIELRDLWRTGATPFKDQPFDEIKPALTRWYVGQRLAQATEAYFQNARSRVVISVSRRAR